MLLQLRFLLVPLGRLFVGVGHAEDRLFVECLAHNLQTDRQLRVGGEAAGNAHTADAGEVDANREDVAEIHLEGIVRLFPDSERRFRRRRGHDDIALLERLLEILTDQRPYFLGAQVIRIVIARAQRIRAENDTPLHLGTEAGAPRLPVHVDHILGTYALSAGYYD